MAYASYADRIAAINADTSLSDDEKKALRSRAAESEYNAPEFDMGQYKELMGSLEASKGRQLRQKSVEDRRNIYAQGISQMLGNF